MTTRTRFAPSPTGFLHVGGARTALYSWLVTRKAGGQFVLRIEDTDRERSTDESVQAILDGIEWLGLDYDEGPIFQTQRFDRYREVVAQLIESGQAYRCYCSKDEVEAMREAARSKGEKPRYDGTCRDGVEPRPGVEPVIRFRNPLDGEVVIQDKIRGEVRIANAELDDLVIARADGTPTYNLTVVVDDMDMGITAVIRGDDHLNNTPRQINLYQALGAEPPDFAHVPMILGDDGARLSKRHGAVSVMQYRDDGFLPQALLNYLVRLGWAHGDQELFSREEMIELFDLDAVNRKPSGFNTDKLIWLNQQYIKTLPAAEIAPHLEWHLSALGMQPENGPELALVIAAQRDRCKTLVEMAEQSRLFFEGFDDYEEKAARKAFKPEALQPLESVRAAYAELNEWSAEPIHQVIRDVAENLELGMGKVAQPIRVAVAGSGVSPSIDVTLAALGRDTTLARLDRAIDYVRQQPEGAPDSD